MEEGTHLHRSFGLQQTNLDLEARFTQHVRSTAAHVWVGVRVGHHDPLYAGPEERFCARRRSSKVIARFEGDVCCGPVRGNPTFLGIMDGHLLCMEAAKMVVPPFRDGHAILHQDTTHGRIGADATLASLGDLKGPPHEFSLVFRPHRNGCGFGFSHMRPRLWARTFILSASPHPPWLGSMPL